MLEGVAPEQIAPRYDPRMRTHWSRVAVVLGCGLTVLAGCGGSSTGSGSPTTASAPPAAPGSAQRLSELVLQPTDFPTGLPVGWTGTPYKANPSGTATETAMLQCLAAPSAADAKVAEGHSQEFSLGDAVISSQATSYRSQSAPDADLALLRDPKAAACFEQTTRKQLAATMPAGATIGSGPMTFTMGSSGGPDNVVATGKGTVPITLAGKQFVLYRDVAFVTGPKIEGEIVFTDFGSAVPDGTQKALIASFAGRVAKG